MRFLLVPALVLSSGCAQAVWTPSVGLPWWETEDQIPAERVVDDCVVVFDEVVIGIPRGGLFSDASLGELVGPQALQLVGASPVTLGEIRVDAAAVPETFEVVFGPVGPAPDPSPRWGNADDGHRSSLGSGGADVRFRVTCGESTVSAALQVGSTEAVCPVPEDLEIASQASFGTALEIDASALLGPDAAALEGLPWVAADSDQDGEVSAEEAAGLVGSAELTARFEASLRSDAGACRAP